MPGADDGAAASGPPDERDRRTGPASGQPASRAIDARTGAVVLDRVRLAAGPWGSFKGLMFDAALPDGHGLLFRPARGIHTHFMRFPIDLIFLDATGTVVAIREAMRPWRFDFTFAAAAIEANGGAARAAGIAVGDRLRFDPPLGGPVG